MVSIRLQHLQWLGGLVVAACCLALGGATLLASLGDYRRFERGTAELDRFQTVMAAASAVSAERVPSNTLMIASAEGRSAAAENLAAARRETDGLIDGAERDVAAVGDAARMDAVREVRTRLREARGKVDAVAQGADLRGGTRMFDAIEALFAAADAAEAMREVFGRAVIMRAPQISTEIFVGMTASRLRDQAGRVGGHVVMMLTTDRSEDERIFARLLETMGRLDALGDVVRSYSSVIFADGSVDAAVKAMDKSFFDRALPFAMLTAQSDARRNTMNVAEFREEFSPALKSLEELRDLIASSSRRKLESKRVDAAWRVGATSVLTGLVCLILVVLAAMFRASLFRPLLQARDEVAAIARGDLSQPAAGRRMSREIREMFDGLTVLRAEQTRKLELERDQSRLTHELKQLSETDLLTGLLNRRALETAAHRLIVDADGRGAPLAVVMFDVDHFKSVNDTYGHAIGDLVLRRIGERLAPLLRPGDSFARFGGEEFIVLLEGVDGAVAVNVAERLRRKLAEVVMSAELKLKVTGSFGVAMREAGSELTWDGFVAIADRRLYAAKKAGRNRVVSSDAQGGEAGAAA